MTRSFIWNFRINITNKGFIPQSSLIISDDTLWEMRFFWPDVDIIVLEGLTEDFLLLANYKIKIREDIYFISAEEDKNIKLRKERLTYKPLIKTHNGAYQFDKKKDLPYAPNFKQVKVTKEALIHTFLQNHKIKMEFSRLKVEDKFYLSLGIESTGYEYVQQLVNTLQIKAQSCDYVSFLKSIIK
jgi:hypothetical protein